MSRRRSGSSYESVSGSLPRPENLFNERSLRRLARVDPALRRARIRELEVRTRLREVELAAQARELVPTAEVAGAWRALVAAVEQRLLMIAPQVKAELGGARVGQRTPPRRSTAKSGGRCRTSRTGGGRRPAVRNRDPGRARD